MLTQKGIYPLTVLYSKRDFIMEYIIGEDHYQSSFIPKSLDELVDENNPLGPVIFVVEKIEEV